MTAPQVTDLKPEDPAGAVERLTKASNTFPDHIGRDGVGTIRARQADVFLVLGELERLLADRARMEKALRGVVDLASDEADFDADEWKQGYDAACDDAANIALEGLGASQ